MQRILLLRLWSADHKHPQGVHLPFTLKYLQALLMERGFTVKLLDGHAQKIAFEETAAELRRFRPDVLVASSTPSQRESLTRLAQQAHHAGALTIAVGQDVSLDPAFYANGSPVDLALPGEAEAVCADTIQALRDGSDLSQMQDHWRKQLQGGRPLLVEEPDGLPFPIYEPGELARYPHLYPMPIGRRAVWGHLLASRGCPYPCNFCTQMTRESYGAGTRKRNPESIAREMLYLKKLGATVLAFDDDNLTTDPHFAEAICGEILRQKIDLPWIAHARVDNLTAGLACLMKQAGCRLLRFGIESAVPRIVELLRKGGVGAKRWRQTVAEATGYAHAAGIPTLGLFIIGNPTETQEEVFQTLELALEIPLDFAQVHFFTPYLGSAALKQFPVGAAEPLAGQHHYRDPLVNLSCVSAQRLVELRSHFYRRFYLRPGWLSRHCLRYGAFYLSNFGTLARLRLL